MCEPRIIHHFYPQLTNNFLLAILFQIYVPIHNFKGFVNETNLTVIFRVNFVLRHIILVHVQPWPRVLTRI